MFIFYLEANIVYSNLFLCDVNVISVIRPFISWLHILCLLLPTPTMAEQLAEYESQLADIEALLEADPSDESVQKLRADLVELIALTKSELASAAAGAGTTGDDEAAPGSAAASSAGDTGEALELPPPPAPVPDSAAAVAAVPEQYQIPATVGDGGATAAPTTEEAAAALAKAEKKKKKNKKKDAAISEFEIPERLQPLPSDTDAERKKKTRAIKALKSKHREKTKEVETAQKQRSWQDFVSGGKKKKKRKGVAGEGSIFATEDGVQARTGVVGGGGGRGTVSGFDDRKRHKH